jgi:drug/metabolite transporter (DMT)-like permease
MTLILISIILSGSLIICFKVFDKFEVTNSNAISINYLFASGSGIIMGFDSFSSTNVLQADWFPYTLLFGLMFISTFNLVAYGVKTSGLMVVSIAQKMSLIIPLAFSIIYYDESYGILKIAGIVMALIAIYFSSKKAKEDTANFSWKILLIPVFIFVGSGVVDISIKVSQEYFGTQAPFSVILACIFGSAGVIGLVQKLIQRSKIQLKDFIGGMCLGLLNFFSTYFLMKALSSDVLESSFVFAINNIGIILFNSMIAAAVFREQITKTNTYGIILALVSIFIIYLSNVI